MASFDVEGARKEGYDDSQIAEFLAKQNRFNLQGARKEGHSDADIVSFLTKQDRTKWVPGSDEAISGSRNVGKPDTTSLLDKAKGVGEAGLAIASGLTSGAVGQVGGTIGGIAGQIATGELGKPEGAARAMETAQSASEALTYAPRTEAGKSALETAGRALDASKLAGVAPDLNAARAVAKPAAAAAQKVGGAVAQGAGTVADVTGGAVAKALTPMPEPRVAALAKKAVDLGIPLRPDQLSKNPIARMVGEALEKVPLSGSKADQRQVGFNRAVGKLIGAEESDRLTPDVFDKAMTKSGEKIGEIAAQTPIRADADFLASLDGVQKTLSKETREVRLIVRDYVNEIKAANQGGVIDGTAFRKIDSDLGAQMRRTPNGDLRHALGELKDNLADALEKNIASPEKLAELKEARKQYAIGLTVEPLVAKATTTGNISPGGLLGRVTKDSAGKRRMARGRGGELGDLAEIGKMFLKEPPSSGTAERALAYGTVGSLSAGAYLEPHTAAAAATGIAGANIYNRAGPAIVRRALRDVDTKKPETRAAKKKRQTEERQIPMREAFEASGEPAEQIPMKKAVGE